MARNRKSRKVFIGIVSFIVMAVITAIVVIFRKPVEDPGDS
jgi:uncharacterized protein YpmB